MRILFANDVLGDAGGVQTYLEAVMAGLIARGRETGFLHCERQTGHNISAKLAPIPLFNVADCGLDRTIAEIKSWSPDVCFSHNMHRLDVERRLLSELPVVKFMHGYFGTCIGGQKTFFYPAPEACHRRFGATCLSLYFPRRCGQMSLNKMVDSYKWARQQNELFHDYKAIIVASEHMKREYLDNGADEEKVYVNPLFPAQLLPDSEPSQTDPAECHVLFLGRMTKLKGADLLIRAVAEASRRLGREIHLTIAGDGPQRASWEDLAKQLGVKAAFPGWVTGDEQVPLLRNVSLLAVPSVWPEPFGLVGLEAARFGVPAIAFDVGGIREWLSDGVNGYLVPGRLPTFAALADGLVHALEQPEQLAAMRRAARNVALKMSLEQHLDKLEAILGGAVYAQEALATTKA